VLKPNEAMIEEVMAIGGRIGLLASFGPTLQSMPPEFPASLTVTPQLAEGALAALDRGDGAEHDRLATEPSTTGWRRRRHAIWPIATRSRWRSSVWRGRPQRSRTRRVSRC
jgi:hypothetical protein